MKAYHNPFDQAQMAAGYETWYKTVGQRADRLEKALLKELLARFPTVETILEVGCGTGHFTRWFEDLGLKAVGLDLSSAMLNEAKGNEGQKVLQSDAHSLPFADHSFDVVALITTLEFLQDPTLALREAQRVAQEGLLIGTINRTSWIGKKYQHQGGVPWDSARFFNPYELVKIVELSGAKKSKLFWKTTLWRWLPWALPLPWGGFIGMAVRIN
jgi:ubiquinone/menaquinone biosynthesis C-methylase UbiE